MNKRDALRLFDYNYWANRKVWGWVMALNEEQFKRASDYSIGSVHKQLVHAMDAEAWWLARACGVATGTFHEAEVFPTRESIRAHWDAIEAEWRTYLNALPDGELQSVAEYTRMADGQVYRTPLWEVLLHLINHGTDHRSQTLAQIHQVGGETSAQDFIYYTREKPLLD